MKKHKLSIVNNNINLQENKMFTLLPKEHRSSTPIINIHHKLKMDFLCHNSDETNNLHTKVKSEELRPTFLNNSINTSKDERKNELGIYQKSKLKIKVLLENNHGRFKKFTIKGIPFFQIKSSTYLI